ncbi:MAG: hypothetical protein Q7T85_02110 [Nitrosomonas sp.]|nr:hypothetical protein [Nitrosomonas sp.]
MTCFDVFSAYHKTMSHRGMQAGLVTVTARIYACLHVGIVHVIFSRKVMYEALVFIATCLKKATDMYCNYAKDTGREKKRLFAIAL